MKTLNDIYRDNPHVAGTDAFFAWRDACSQVYDKWYRYHRADNREYDNAHADCLKYLQVVCDLIPDVKIIECN